MCNDKFNNSPFLGMTLLRCRFTESYRDAGIVGKSNDMNDDTEVNRVDGQNQQRWFAAVVLLFMFLGTKSRSMAEKVCAGCSCYTFYTEMKAWVKSKEDCTTNNGSLVVMETVEEWEFINSEIKKLTVNEASNEWYIGLTGKTTGDWKTLSSLPAQTKSKRKGWKWINGNKLTIDKWQPGQPSGDTMKGGDACVVMAKNYPTGKPGLFNDLPCLDKLKPYICEYSKDCKKTKSTTIQQTTPTTFKPSISVQSSTITTPTTKPQTTTTSTTLHTSTTKPTTSKPLSSFRTFNKVTTVKPVPKTSTFKPTLSTTTTSPTRKQSEERQSSEKGFPLVLIIIVLCVLLSVGICLVLAVCFWRRQKKAKSRKSSDNSNRSNRCKQTGEVSTATTEIINDSYFVAFTMVHNNLTHTKSPTEDPENTTLRTENNMSVTMETPLTTNSGETLTKQEPLYASVDKSKKFSIKKKKSSRRVNSKRKSKVKMKEASLPSSSCEANEAVYATVAKDKQQQPQPQIMYADLAEFNNNGSSPPVKPTPYQPVEYAVIIGKKVSK